MSTPAVEISRPDLAWETRTDASAFTGRGVEAFRRVKKTRWRPLAPAAAFHGLERGHLLARRDVQLRPLRHAMRIISALFIAALSVALALF
jgi:hypothetical protein